MSPAGLPPGWVDLQVNGFAGIDFSAPGLTVEAVQRVAEELASRGTAAFCPTVITSPIEVYEQNLPVLAEAASRSGSGAIILGIHLEGPFISREDGARGAHSRDSVQLPNVDLFRRLDDLAGGRVVLLTLAPELPGAPDVITAATELGVTVSLGHHLASETEISRACDCGARAVTHFGNGIPNLLPRHPNPLWSQLAEPRLTLMLITDGHHVPASLIRVAFQCRGVERTVVVSDAAPVAGLPPGRYRTLGQEVELEPSGRLWNPVGKHLVGSSASMRECMAFLQSLGLTDDAGRQKVGRENALALIRRGQGHGHTDGHGLNTD
jgi:N-acetylglucosamine-6-phosphate deacetylase